MSFSKETPLRHLGTVVMILAVAGCGERTPPPPPTPTAAPVVAAAPTAPSTPPQPESLPRLLDGVALGSPRAAVEQQLGKLVCHQNADGLDVCGAADNPEAVKQKLEIFFYRGVVVSLAHDTGASTDVWTQLEPLLTRYGTPALNGRRERDRDNRLHELYGWKDDATLYSIRFVWKEDEDKRRQLVGTTVTLWDRQGYADWERDPARQNQPPPTPEVI